MYPTAFGDVNRMVRLVQLSIANILGDDLLALYLSGSIVTGDFDLAVSDIDFVAVIRTDLNQRQFDALENMHIALSQQEKAWDNRIEVAYLTPSALKSFRTHSSTIAITSPGEPFHYRDANHLWTINWYVVREFGVTLVGPQPTTFIDSISTEELVDAVRTCGILWREWIIGARSRNAQVYAILTICRALYTFRLKSFTSKRQAALWAARAMPERASCIHSALRSWREDWYLVDIDHAATMDETTAFVLHVADLIEFERLSTETISA